MHPSIATNSEAFIKRGQSSDPMKCYLCEDASAHVPSKVTKHIENYHLHHSLTWLHYIIVPCKLTCTSGDGHRAKAHYHCPCCAWITTNKSRCASHYKKHIDVYTDHSEFSSKSSDSSCRPSSVLIDPISGVHMVSLKESGENIPIHVVAHWSNDNTFEYMCSDEHCSISMDSAKTHNTTNYLCQHLRRVKSETFVPNTWSEKDFDISTLSKAEKEIYWRDLPKLQMERCPLVVNWPHSKSYQYYSVACEKSKYFPFSRLFVKFSRHNNKYICDCRRISQLRCCIHVIITKLYKCFMNGSILSPNEPSIEPEPVSENINSTDRNSSLTEQEISYQLHTKKYPVKFPNGVLGKSITDLENITCLAPTETHCPHCNDILSGPSTYCRSGYIMDPKTIISNVKLCFKKCLKCNIRYYYKEWKDGLHVSSNKLILTLDMCLLTREFLRNSTSPGRTGKTFLNFLRQLGKDSPIADKDFRESYINFELFCKYDYNFNCLICGHNPSILITDVCRKGFVKLPVALVENGKDGPRNMINFWNKLSEHLLLQTNVEHLIDSWAPWISPKLSEENVESNEFGKGKGHQVPISEDVMFSPEELEDLFASNSKEDIFKTLKDANIAFDRTSSKERLINLLIKSIHMTPAFSKKLYSIQGGSGGWLAFSCPHGIVYVVKALLKHESPSDYVDILLSLKIPPAVIICDMPDRIARNLHRRAPALLRPHLGMLAAPTTVNIASAKEKKLKVRIPALSSSSHSIREDQSVPQSNSSAMYILYDNFHKSNSKRESEILRHVNHVEGLKNLNTQVSEQLNSVIGRDHYFLDRMTLGRHYFMLRLVIHLLNLHRNEKTLKSMERANPGALLNTDSVGRLYVTVPPSEAVYKPNLSTSLKLERRSNSLSGYNFKRLDANSSCANNNDKTSSIMTSANSSSPPISNACDLTIQDSSHRSQIITLSDETRDVFLKGPTAVTTMSSLISPHNTPDVDRMNDVSNFDISLDNLDFSFGSGDELIGTSGNASSNLCSHMPVKTKSKERQANISTTRDEIANEISAASSPSKHATSINTFKSVSKEDRVKKELELIDTLLFETRPDYLLYEINKTKVFVSDIYALTRNKFLNDTIINVSLHMLTQQNAGVHFFAPTLVSILFSLHKEDVDNGILKELTDNMDKDIILLPWCEHNHWRLIVLWPQTTNWAIMDPLGETVFNNRRVTTTLVSKYLSAITSTSWSCKTVPYDLQSDMTSCGIFVIKYACSLGKVEEAFNRLTVEMSRKYLAEKIIRNGDISEDFCTYCAKMYPKDHSNGVKWVQCDECSRWIHTSCVSTDIALLLNISKTEFLCNVCERLLKRKRQNLQCQQQCNLQSVNCQKPSPETKSKLTEISLTEKDFSFEVIIIEETKARICAGCKKPLLSRKRNTSRQRSIGLKKQYFRDIYNSHLKKNMTVKSIMYVHSYKTCVEKTDPLWKCLSPSQFLINEKCFNELLFFPQKCSRFENEFSIKLNDVSKSV